MLDRVDGRGARAEGPGLDAAGPALVRGGLGSAGGPARGGLALASGVLAAAARSVEGAGIAGGGSGAAPRDALDGLLGELRARAERDPEGMLALLRAAFGDRADGPAGRALLARLAAGALPPPELRLAGAETLPPGARGAYVAGGGGVIVLDRRLLGDPAALGRVLAEELGHHLDRQLGSGDARGDEGALFARLLAGERLGPGERARLGAEDDRGRLLDGRAAEFDGLWSSYTVERAREELNPDPRGRHQLPDVTPPDGGGGGGEEPPPPVEIVDAVPDPEGDLDLLEAGKGAHGYDEGPLTHDPGRHGYDDGPVTEGSPTQGSDDRGSATGGAEASSDGGSSGGGSSALAPTTSPRPPARPDAGGAADDGAGGGAGGSQAGGGSQPTAGAGGTDGAGGTAAGGTGATGAPEGARPLDGPMADDGDEPAPFGVGRPRDGAGDGGGTAPPADPRAAWRGPDGRLPDGAEAWLERARVLVEVWARSGADGRRAMSETADRAEAQPRGREGRPAPEAWALARALGEAAERGQGSERFGREALDRALDLDPLGAAQGHADRGGTFGRALAGEGLATRAEALDAVGRSHVSEGTGRWMLSGLVAEGGLDPNTLDGRAAKASRREAELGLRREVAQAWAEAYTDASEAAEARTAGRLEALLATPEGRALLEEIGERDRPERMGLMERLAADPTLDAQAIEGATMRYDPAAGEERLYLAQEWQDEVQGRLEGAIDRPGADGGSVERAFERALGQDPEAAVGAFGGDDEFLGEALGELDRRDLATALGAMADGAVADRTARRALGELTAEMDVEALLNGRSAIPGRPGAERELRGQYARAAVEAFARRDAPESFAEAAERVEELLATRHGRRLLEEAQRMSPAEGRALLRELASDPRLDAETAEQGLAHDAFGGTRLHREHLEARGDRVGKLLDRGGWAALRQMGGEVLGDGMSTAEALSEADAFAKEYSELSGGRLGGHLTPEEEERLAELNAQATERAEEAGGEFLEFLTDIPGIVGEQARFVQESARRLDATIGAYTKGLATEEEALAAARENAYVALQILGFAKGTASTALGIVRGPSDGRGGGRITPEDIARRREQAERDTAEMQGRLDVDQALTESRQNLSIGDQQLSRKMNTHGADFGLDVRRADDRNRFREIVEDIVENPTHRGVGVFSGQGGPGKPGETHFFLQGDTVVLLKPDGEFITTFRDATGNKFVREALGLDD